jgi:hypothetical protein
MKRLLPLLRNLAFRLFQIGSVCLLTALVPLGAAASQHLALSSVPEVFEVRTPPKLTKPKHLPDKVPDHLRIKYDQNFRHGLV